MCFAERHISQCQQRCSHETVGIHPADHPANAATTAVDNRAATATTAAATKYHVFDSGRHADTKDTKTVHQIHRLARKYLQQFRKRERDQQREIESETEDLESGEKMKIKKPMYLFFFYTVYFFQFILITYRTKRI